MAGAFQANAFQNNAFQVDSGGSPPPPPPHRLGGIEEYPDPFPSKTRKSRTEERDAAIEAVKAAYEELSGERAEVVAPVVAAVAPFIAEAADVGTAALPAAPAIDWKQIFAKHKMAMVEAAIAQSRALAAEWAEYERLAAEAEAAEVQELLAAYMQWEQEIVAKAVAIVQQWQKKRDGGNTPV
jgi:hypothetical protein